MLHCCEFSSDTLMFKTRNSTKRIQNMSLIKLCCTEVEGWPVFYSWQLSGILVKLSEGSVPAEMFPILHKHCRHYRSNVPAMDPWHPSGDHRAGCRTYLHPLETCCSWCSIFHTSEMPLQELWHLSALCCHSATTSALAAKKEKGHLKSKPLVEPEKNETEAWPINYHSSLKTRNEILLIINK